jgi:AcrR family transcriptional regulator
MAKPKPNGETRQEILRAALKRFAHAGYAAASVQQIVADAKVSKPSLYYYFTDKAGLFQALVNEAHDARYHLLQEAAARSRDIRGKLEAILAALFDYFAENRELVRISFATMFAAPGEVPEGFSCQKKCERNFEFVHSLIRRARADGELDGRFDSRELTYGFYGLTNFYLAANLLMADCQPDRQVAGRIVDLFLAGAAAPRSKERVPRKSR